MAKTNKIDLQVYQLFTGQALSTLTLLKSAIPSAYEKEFINRLKSELHNLKDGFHLFEMNEALQILEELSFKKSDWEKNRIHETLNKLELQFNQLTPSYPKEILASTILKQIHRRIPGSGFSKLTMSGLDPALNFQNYPQLFSCFSQILINAIDHGLKPMYKNNPEFAAEIKIDIVDNHSFHTINIFDNGLGLSSTSSESDPTISGDGLGIQACQKMIKEMNGTISFSELSDKGTLVVITLPKHTLQKIA